jgi:hypothetical protein
VLILLPLRLLLLLLLLLQVCSSLLLRAEQPVGQPGCCAAVCVLGYRPDCAASRF